MLDKELINNTEAEKLVLGTLLTERNALDECARLLNEDCFYNQTHRAVYNAIVKVSARGERPDTIAVQRQILADKVEVTIYELTELSTHHTFDVVQYARYLRDMSVRRKFFELGARLQENSVREDEELENIISETNDTLISMLDIKEDNVKTINDGLESLYDTICTNMQDNVVSTGKLTGFDFFDKRTGGFQKSDFIIIAGETSQGKTSLALSILYNMALNGEKSAIYSLEMNLTQICARLTAMGSGVSSKDIMYAKLDNDTFDKVNKGIGRLQGMEIYIDESSTSNIEVILSSMRYMRIKLGVEVFVIDYLQLVSAGGLKGNKEQQTAYIARKLKNIAKELDITVIALSQLSRNRDYPMPTLGRLRDSGQIEEAADVVMLVYRPSYYKRAFPEPFEDLETDGYALIDIAKGRNIGVFQFLCGFNPPTTHFYNIHLRDVPQKGFKPSNTKDMPF